MRLPARLAIAALLLAAGCAGRVPPPRELPPPPPSAPPPTGKAQIESGTSPPEAGKVEAQGRPAPRIPIVRIGIAPEVESAAIQCAAPWRLGVMGAGSGTEEIRPGTKVTFSADGGILRMASGGGPTRSAGADTLFACPGDPHEAPLDVNGRKYRGELLIYPAGSGRVTVVNVVDLESYLRSVVPAEIGGAAGERLEAVKAQAVAARSYTLACFQRWRGRGFDLLATVEDQVYQGVAGERKDVDEALRATTGVVALHNGRPIEAFYCSTCGGTTSTPEEVWGRSSRGDYLVVRADRSSESEEAFCSASPQYRWTESWDGAALEKILKSTLPRVRGAKKPKSWGALRDITISKRTESGRVRTLKIVFENATFKVGRDALRWVLRRPSGGGLRSALLHEVIVKKSQGRVTRVKITGGGYGHGVGMCQFGALGMARSGYDYASILQFYYRGVRLIRAYESWPG